MKRSRSRSHLTRIPLLPHNPACPHAIAAYALQGAYLVRDDAIEALLMDARRATRWERPLEGRYQHWTFPGRDDLRGWRVIGWRRLDGAWPHGPPHAIDVALIEWSRAPDIATVPATTYYYGSKP